MNIDDNNSLPSGDHETQPIDGNDRTVMLDVPRDLGCFQLRRLLGRGGMGEVWLAEDKNLDRDVAIKLMRKELLQNEDANRRFAREARAVGRLNHPNIVHVYSFGDEKGLLYFAMELVDGETVAQRLKRVRCLGLEEAVAIVLQAIEGLGYACERGIIHRDIKPSNLMLTSDGRVKIADFGLAKMTQHDTQMTAAGTAMGSPSYMSPEQARGEEADHRSDIYALGVSLYQMLCGTLPYTADSPLTLLLKHIQDPLPEPEDLRNMKEGAVLNVIKRMTAKRPEDRYQSYNDLAAALLAIQPVSGYRGAHVATSSIPAAPSPGNTANAAPLPQNSSKTTTADTPTAPRTSSGMLIVAVAVALLLTIAGIAWILSSLGNRNDSVAPAAAQQDQAQEQSGSENAPESSPQPVSPSPAQSQTPIAPPATSNQSAAPTPTATPAITPSPTAPTPSPSMQPVDVTTDLPITPTPYPGQNLQPTPRPQLRDLLPEGIPTVAPRR